MIDSHLHLWQIDRPDHEWPTPDLGGIYHDATEAGYRTALPSVTAAVLVQAQPSDSASDWLVETAAASDLIQGIVAWADLSADSAPARLAALAARPKVKGIRPMLQALTDDAWILRPEVKPALRALCDLGLSLDALILPRHMAHIVELARLWPDLSIIVDHCAKPPIAAAAPDQTAAWHEALSHLADQGNVGCKLSGLVTEAGEAQSLDVVASYADHALAVFGPDRLMWGSDWPVLTLNTSAVDWLDWTLAWLSGQPANVRTAVLGTTARRLYRLN